MSVIKLDYDKKVRWGKERFLQAVDILRLNVRNLRVFETSKGLHVSFETKRQFSDCEAVAIQAILGSDWKREAYNMIRCRNGGSLGRHNVLFSKKWTYRNGKVVGFSEEVRREDIERELLSRIREIKESWKYMEEVRAFQFPQGS